MQNQLQQTILTNSTSLTDNFVNGVSANSLMFNNNVNAINSTNSLGLLQNGSINNISLASLNVTTITAQNGTIGGFNIDTNRLYSQNGNLVFDALNDEILVSFNGIPQILITGSN